MDAVKLYWETLFRAERVTPQLIEEAYAEHRGGLEVSETPRVLILVPAYNASEPHQRASVNATMLDLRENGIEADYCETSGDSLVTRGRHCLVHLFMCSQATHLLQWDADVEMVDPTAVRKMVASGHDVVGCAYPWRDGSGRVVCNPLRDGVGPDGRAGARIDVHNCMPVAEIGTGFLMTSRKVITDLMSRHPELLYEADLSDYLGCPMWALFDAYLETKPNGRKRYASEDWRFCSLARAAGHAVNVYYPPILRHWGKVAHEGHITKAWDLKAAE